MEYTLSNFKSDTNTPSLSIQIYFRNSKKAKVKPREVKAERPGRRARQSTSAQVHLQQQCLISMRMSKNRLIWDLGVGHRIIPMFKVLKMESSLTLTHHITTMSLKLMRKTYLMTLFMLMTISIRLLESKRRILWFLAAAWAAARRHMSQVRAILPVCCSCPPSSQSGPLLKTKLDKS